MVEEKSEIKHSRTRQKPKDKMQVFKETQLPFIIALTAAILILIFIIGSISNAVKRHKITKEAQQATSQQTAMDKKSLDKLVAELLDQAEAGIEQYGYDTALTLLEPVAEHADKYPQLKKKLQEYNEALATMVAWDDPSKIVNLSFQMLIADPSLAFTNDTYGKSLNQNYLTTEEFTAILTQLYENGYVLVNNSDLFTTEASPDGTIITKAKTVYLPIEKRPIAITQTNVNYNYYLIDSDDDKLPDQNGCGFASKLVLENGTITNEMVDKNGDTVRGNFDLIPILESFVAEHPDFSYQGSKATVAVTGYDGLFGYRTAASDKERLGDAYTQEVAQATEIAQWLRDNGYDLACYTYRNMAYGAATLEQVQNDLEQWNEEVTPLIGQVDILVYAQNSDISASTGYTGDLFDLLKNNGFRYYLGFSDGGAWATLTDDYARHGRILVSGASLKHHSDWYIGVLDPSNILDATRGEVPNL